MVDTGFSPMERAGGQIEPGTEPAFIPGRRTLDDAEA
jgi:hypothetical protein